MTFLLSDAWINLTSHFRKPSSEICIVGIDSDSLAMVPARWPWPRNHYAKLIKKVAEAEPALILFDIFLQHPQAESYGDEILAKTITECGNIILVSYIEEKNFDIGVQKFWFQNLELIRDAALFQGIVGACIDADGITRSFPVYDGDYQVKSCAPWVVERFTKTTKEAQSPFTDSRPVLLFHAKEGGETARVSAASILKNQISSDILKDKIVIIGATAPILHDFHNTSRGFLSGPHLLATSIDTLLSRPPTFIDNGIVRKLALLLFGAAVALFFTFRELKRPVKSLISIIFSIILFWIIALEIFSLYLPVGIAIFNALLLHISINGIKMILDVIESQIIKNENAAAGKVQQDLFPASFLNTDTHSIYGLCIPCTSAGGDFFEIFAHSSGKSFFAIIDVMGHGIPAAMVTLMVKTVISLHRMRPKFLLQECIEDINRVIVQEFNRKKMLTGIFGLFQPLTGECELVIAGHPAALYMRPGHPPQELGYNSSPLGLLKKTKLNRLSFNMQKNEALVLYTDGIVEALNWQNEPFGYENWQSSLERKLDLNGKMTRPEILLEDIKIHTDGRSVDDDQTILVLHIH